MPPLCPPLPWSNPSKIPLGAPPGQPPALTVCDLSLVLTAGCRVSSWPLPPEHCGPLAVHPTQRMQLPRSVLCTEKSRLRRLTWHLPEASHPPGQTASSPGSQKSSSSSVGRHRAEASWVISPTHGSPAARPRLDPPPFSAVRDGQSLSAHFCFSLCLTVLFPTSPSSVPGATEKMKQSGGATAS